MTKNTENKRRYMNETQAGEYLGLSTRTLQRYRVDGSGPIYAKAGSRMIYDINDCDDWIASFKVCNTIQGTNLIS